MVDLIIKANASTGASLLLNGKPVVLAAITEDGEKIAEGNALSEALFSAILEAQENQWIGEGHLTVIRKVQ